MYSVELDENKYFTGSYASVGSVEGGIFVEELPPANGHQCCYKYDYHDVTTEETVMVPVIDKETGMQKFENGEPVFDTETRSVTRSVLGWVFDEQKHHELMEQEFNAVKQAKISELSSICEQTIFEGLDIETTLGVEHFSLEISDQLEIINQYNNVLNGAKEIPYHSDDKPCRMFSAEEMITVATKSSEYVLYNRTYFNYIKETVKRCTTVEEVNNVNWGMALSEDLDAKFVEITGVSTR